MKKRKQSTIYQDIVLASSSPTRKRYIKKFIPNCKICHHKIEEQEIKKKQLNPHICASILAKEKAISIKNLYPKHKIIGSDQILVCRDKIVSKPKDEEQAIRNLMLLQNNVHILVSAVSVIFGDKIFYETVKVAKLFFRSTTESEIKRYIQENNTAVFSSVGSYRIEDNKKYNLVEILSGDNETIIGFPIKNLLEKFQNE